MHTLKQSKGREQEVCSGCCSM